MPKVHRLGESTHDDCLVLRAIREEHANWNWFNDHGYIKYHSPDYTSAIFEHRLVATKVFGVELNPRIHVHHKNEIRNDNRSDNLQLLSIHEHASLHHSQNTLTVHCELCGKEIRRGPFKTGRNEHQFCSQKCFKFFSRKATRPAANELESLITTVGSYCELGRMFGVCDRTIRDWAKDYGISSARRKRMATPTIDLTSCDSAPPAT